MHRMSVIHRDLKPENILIQFVIYFLCREFINFVILVGQFIHQIVYETLFVERLSTCLHKLSKVKNTQWLLITGLLVFSLTNSLLDALLSKSTQVNNLLKLYVNLLFR